MKEKQTNKQYIKQNITKTKQNKTNTKTKLTSGQIYFQKTSCTLQVYTPIKLLFDWQVLTTLQIYSR